MSNRREEYALPDGSTCEDRHYALLASEISVIEAALATTVFVLPQYFTATGLHESTFALNEVDTEPSGFVSKGIFQISDEEAKRVGMPNANLYDLYDSTKVLTKLAEERVSNIAKWSNLTAPSRYIRAYLTIGHNQGDHALEATIKAHGCDWQAYQDRNMKEALDKLKAATTHDEYITAKTKLNWWYSVFHYGNDAITGGAGYPAPAPAVV